jgi:hypothetical protein
MANQVLERAVRVRSVASVVVLAAAVAVSACSSRGTHSASATGRVPGDNGKLLPTISCWIGVSATSGGYDSVIGVVNPNGGNANCNTVISELDQSLPSGFAATVTSPLSKGEMDPSEVGCSGMFYGDRVTAFITYSGGDSGIDPTCQALMLLNG